MIVSESDLKTLFGLSESITDEEQAMLTILHPMAEGAVKSYLQYDPEQMEHTEYLPRHSHSGGPGFLDYGEWTVDSGHSRAVYVVASAWRELQVTHLPLRKITTVHVDTDAYHGKGTDAFAASTLWANGTDYYAKFERPKVCQSGHIVANSSWPMEPGCVKVVYTSGYSEAEFAGTASTDVDDGSIITSAGLDASPIRSVVMTVANRLLRAWQNLKKQTGVGFVPGAINSEKLGDYSYTLGNSSDSMFSGKTTLTNDEKELLRPFEHYGTRLL